MKLPGRAVYSTQFSGALEHYLLKGVVKSANNHPFEGFF